MVNEYFKSYVDLFSRMTVNNDKKKFIDAIVAKINLGKARYQGLQAITGVPWFVIGLIHYMEANCDFTKHLHNGDPLSARTIKYPAGYPREGKPPFTFEQSAVSAIKKQNMHKVDDWSVPNILLLLEQYNGMGYRDKTNINSPYLWSFSNLYTKGKYVADNKYDPNAVSKQAGAGVILKRVLEVNNLITVSVATGGSLIVAAAIFFLIFNAE
ncbi:MAG: peptidoglycan-binding protein [Ferruginibacter sp.]|nr:peptidoglycan-binding protein [Ferruginibacter sp.]